MTRFFYRLTGGRPMVFEERGFWDDIEQTYINIYRSRLDGTLYMAMNRWGLFRVSAGKQWP